MRKLLVLGLVWPEPTSSAAGSRMLQLIRLFTEWDVEVVFASPAQKSLHSADLQKMGIEEVQININDAGFDTFIQHLQPTHVLYDRFIMEEQLGWRVHQHCPQAMTLLDTEDLHFLRKARQACFQQGIECTNAQLFTEDCKREIASILRCDLSLIISAVEIKLLENVFQVPASQLWHLPFLVEDAEIIHPEEYYPFQKRKNFISIGNFLHAPNWDQVRYLKEEIWPLIHAQLPAAEMHVYGAYAHEKAQQLHAPKQGFYIKGRAENALETLQKAKVLLAPLRFGAGLKGKLLDALLTGTPSVTTSIGMEGMADSLPWAGAIADTPEEFAQQAIRLYKEEEYAKGVQQNAVKILQTYFRKSLLAHHFLYRLFKIEQNLENHRQHHFLGQILHHQLWQSTKYMSLWIEEKNKANRQPL